tara:strand:+ start:176 stop:1816 length:1641 start_codon:yes stop_codon:yes gene_type:complete
MYSSSDLISARRESVLQAYNSARAENHLRFIERNDKATKEYIFPNQITDANNIIDKFYKNKRRVISIQKKTKVGADGLMIEIAKLLTTHIDDQFVVNPVNVRIITGMSNAGWEKDMISKAPNCFKDKIFHHGKLSKSDLKNLRNGLIIIDEIDSGDKEHLVLHKNLKEAGVLDVEHMNTHNNRFVFISATMIKELYDLYRWGELHELHKMIIPTEYIGHNDFLDKEIVKEFYPLTTEENAEKWVQEDILNYYETDYRVHIVRVNTKTGHVVQNACIRKGVAFRNHTSTDRLSNDELEEFFKKPLTQHIVLGVKGLFRRANLIPNIWKLRVGATHELYVKNVDNNVQIQGLTGRMTGYWRDDIEKGHKTGPHRTSIEAIKQYEITYNDPFGTNSYQTAGFNKKKGKVVATPTMLSTKNIKNMEAVDLPMVKDEEVDINLYRIYANEAIVRDVCKMLSYNYVSTKDNADGFKETSLNNKKSVVSLLDAVKKVPTAYGTNNGEMTYRTYYPCYVDTTDNTSLRFVVIIRPRTDKSKVAECDEKYTSIRF